MARYPTTGSTLKSSISTSLSTQIIITVDNEPVGAIQSINITQSRGLERVRELGTDGILEIVPKQATEYEATITRVVFDRLRITEAFKRGFINIKSQVIPFDIQITDKTNGESGQVVHYLSGCWFTRYSPRYQADNFIIQEEAQIWIEDIRTTIGSSSAAKGGARGIVPQTESTGREIATDTGAGGSNGGMGYRGTMDVANITNLVFKE